MSVKSLAPIPKLEVVVKVMRMLAIPVVLIYGNYFFLTNEGYPQMIQHEQFMEETDVFLLAVKERKKPKWIYLHSCSTHTYIRL